MHRDAPENRHPAQAGAHLYRASDGKASYLYPTRTGRGSGLVHSSPGPLYVRDDLLKKLKLGYPTTPQDLATYLKRCMQEIGTIAGGPVIGLTLDENLSGIDQFLYSGLAIDPRQNNKVVNYLYTDSSEMMRAAKYSNQLYRLVEGPVEVRKMPAITSARSEMFAKVLLAESEAEAEAIVNARAKSCKDMGIDEIIAERQKYLDNFKL